MNSNDVEPRRWHLGKHTRAPARASQLMLNMHQMQQVCRFAHILTRLPDQKHAGDGVGGQRVKLPDISVTILLFTYGRNYTDYVTIHFIFFFPQFSIARLRFVPVIPSFHISYSSHLMYLASARLVSFYISSLLRD